MQRIALHPLEENGTLKEEVKDASFKWIDKDGNEVGYITIYHDGLVEFNAHKGKACVSIENIGRASMKVVVNDTTIIPTVH